MTCDSCGFRNDSKAATCAICAKVFANVPAQATQSIGAVPIEKTHSRQNYRKGLLLGTWGAGGGIIGNVGGDILIHGADHTVLQTLVHVGGWFGLVGMGITVSTVIGQMRYLGRRDVPWKNLIISAGFGFVAAFVAGCVAQIAYSLVAPTEWFRAICWGLAGALIGAGLSMRIPNLGFLRGLAGGFGGGLVGGGLFLLSAYTISDVMGRYIGCAAIGFLIAFMVVLTESLFREAWIEVIYSHLERRTVNLGSDPITIGSDPAQCTVFVSGIAPIAYSYSLDEKRITSLDVPSGKITYPKRDTVQSVGNVQIAFRGA